MARPTPIDDDTLRVVISKLKAQVAELRTRSYARIGTRWKLHQVGDNLVASSRAAQVVLGTPEGNCPQTVACVAGALDATLLYDADAGELGVRISGDAGNALRVGTDGGLYMAAGAAGAASSGPRLFRNATVAEFRYNVENSTTIEVTGVAGNASADQRVYVNISHVSRGLLVELIAPDSTVYVLQAAGTGSERFVPREFVVDASSSPASGTWTLRAEDMAYDSPAASNIGTIRMWQMTFW